MRTTLCRSIVALGLAGLSVPAALAQESDRAAEGFTAVQQLQIVDCLLPGQVRVVGGRPYITPRRPTRTTASDCGARGGEYLAYDRADYRSALNVWLPAAERGEAEAQNIVGEIFERGLGTAPNYEAAADWYRRAADQGYSRAQFNLGTLYEQGLGVPEDRLEALNWYRVASGLSEDSVIFQSAAAAEQAELRARLEEQLEQRQREIDVLQQQIGTLEEQLRDREGAAAQLGTLRGLLAQLESQRAADQARLAAVSSDGVSRVRSAQSTRETERRGGFRRRGAVADGRRSFGGYYALIIGVQNYDALDDLQSPLNDVSRAQQLLEEKYGFSVLTLIDPDQLTMMTAVNDLNDTLTDDDNLLIYFAGHGSRLSTGVRETGYWLPTDADPAPNNRLWVPNEFVSGHLGRLNAKRVLVVSDSCYAGLLGDDPGFVMVGNEEYTPEYIAWKMPKRSRMVLASGGDSPVLDDDGAGHSVFARAFLEELESNERLLTAPELFLRVRQRVRQSEPAAEIGQEPQLKVIKEAGHEVGDFFFVPG